MNEVKINHLHRFIIYVADNSNNVQFTLGTTKSIPFNTCIKEYRFNGIKDDLALAIYTMVKTAVTNGADFYGKTAEVVNAFCKTCKIDTPVGVQCHK